MKQLTCEMCGGTNLVKQDGLFVCQTCGCKYTVEEARRMMFGDDAQTPAPAQPAGNSTLIENYLSMAQNALGANNHAEAESYANKIIELNPRHSQAWLIKGEAAGWQSTVQNNRMAEAVNAWVNAVLFADPAERNDVREQVADKYGNLFVASVSLHAGNFGKVQSAQNLNSALGAVRSGIQMMNTLTFKAGIVFNRAVWYNAVAKALNSGAADGYRAASADYGPSHANMVEWRWRNFYQAGDNCLTMLGRALDICRDPALGKTICGNAITIGNAVRDAKSYKFDVNSWTADHYVEEYSFTADAKKSRNAMISGWERQKRDFETELAQEVLQKLGGGREQEELANGLRLYWEEHAQEKAQLELERESLEQRATTIEAELRQLPAVTEAARQQEELRKIDSQISSLTARLNSLGLFKGKEKKQLQGEIDALSAQRTRAKGTADRSEQAAKDASAPLNKELQEAKARIGEIGTELTKSRGRVALGGDISIPGAIVDGKIMATPEQLRDWMTEHLASPYKVKSLATSTEAFGAEMGTHFQLSLIDSSKDEKNNSAGINIYFYADAIDAPITAILMTHCWAPHGPLNVAYVDARNSLNILARFGAYILMALQPGTTQTDAESMICRMLCNKSNTTTQRGDLSMHYVSNDEKVLNLMELSCTGILIRVAE